MEDFEYSGECELSIGKTVVGRFELAFAKVTPPGKVMADSFGTLGGVDAQLWERLKRERKPIVLRFDGWRVEVLVRRLGSVSGTVEVEGAGAPMKEQG